MLLIIWMNCNWMVRSYEWIAWQSNQCGNCLLLWQSAGIAFSGIREGQDTPDGIASPDGTVSWNGIASPLLIMLLSSQTWWMKKGTPSEWPKKHSSMAVQPAPVWSHYRVDRGHKHISLRNKLDPTTVVGLCWDCNVSTVMYATSWRGRTMSGSQQWHVINKTSLHNQMKEKRNIKPQSKALWKRLSSLIKPKATNRNRNRKPYSVFHCC